VYKESGENITIFGEAEIIRIKAFMKNIGNENSTNTDVFFYSDSLDDSNLIGIKNYDTVSKYQKYPSVIWDTSGITPGQHDILVLADKNNYIDKLDEYNNELSITIDILNTHPSKEERKILIAELYYYAHPNLENEFIAIYNPTDICLNVSDWYFTNDPVKIKTDQTKIIFPADAIIEPFSYIYITQNAETYMWETDERPDFEYNSDSDENVPQMIASKKFILSNKGEILALKDEYNHTIDIVVYDEQNYNGIGWVGNSITGLGEGVILKRNFKQDSALVDTNTSYDWVNNRIYKIGQSDFPYEDITFNGEIITFVSPDSSFNALIKEIQKANDSIFLNVYEFTNLFLCDELLSALRRDVKVNILLEGAPIGGICDEEKFILSKISAYGGNIRFIVNDPENNAYSRYRYNHAKYLIIDNETVIVESCNWGNTGIPREPDFGNREWGIIVKNENIAEYFLNVFYDDWNPNRCDSYSFNDMKFNVDPNFFINKKIFGQISKANFESSKFIGNFSAVPVFSPDTSYNAIYEMIESADKCIYIEQLYIYKNWGDKISPFVEQLVNKSKKGLDVRVILNYNPVYDSTNEKINLTKDYLEDNDIKVKFLYTNWSYFVNVHNKGIVVDNESVLVSSINWNENSFMSNREAGIIIKNESVASYYAEVFFYDWNLKEPQDNQEKNVIQVEDDYENTIYITVIFTMTFLVIARDWRKRQWT
jgi:phosphatidylserine/phosphatidylglycerophosphate/cardiolipin synthase-like enzyme